MKELLEEYDLYCEMCKASMTQQDHDFCDICGDCLENNVED